MKTLVRNILPRSVRRGLGKLLQANTYKLNLAGLYFDLFIREYESYGCRFKVPYELTNRRFRGRFALNKYETSEEIKYVQKYVGSDAQVLELGACIGVMACVTNRQLEDPNRHMVVEANPNLIQYLISNRETNKCRFKVENCIVSDKKQNEFYIHPLIVGGSSQRTTDTKIYVVGKKVSDLEKYYSLKFDTLVMDIEGGELDFLRTNGLFLNQLKTVLMETHHFNGILSQGEAKECEQILRQKNFEKVDETAKGSYQVWTKK